VKEHFFVGMGLQGQLTKPWTMADSNISYIFVSIKAGFSLRRHFARGAEFFFLS
jgi:hypothetical protein